VTKTWLAEALGSMCTLLLLFFIYLLLRSASEDTNELTSAAICFIITNIEHWYIGLHMLF
jgi:hypothetical protein